MSRLPVVVLLAVALASMTVWVGVAARVVMDPVNHVGIEPMLATVPFALLVPIAWMPGPLRSRRTRAVVTAYAVLSIVALVAIDRANVLVQYDRWCRRGMPERPCGAVARLVWACTP